MKKIKSEYKENCDEPKELCYTDKKYPLWPICQVKKSYDGMFNIYISSWKVEHFPPPPRTLTPLSVVYLLCYYNEE